MKDVHKLRRTYLPESLNVNTWDDVASYYTELTDRTIANKEELLQWMANRSETDAVVDEEYRWRYIRQTCNTEDETHAKVYDNFIEHIMPHWMTVTNLLNKKIAHSNFINELDQERFFVYIRNLKAQLQLFREENIPLIQKTQLLSQEYGAIIAAMTIEHNGKEYTLPQANALLQQQDRTLRKAIYEKISNRRFKDRDKLNHLFAELLAIRHQIALNAGFDNYRSYIFVEMGRFDYTVQDCEQFHEAIKTEVIPLVEKIHATRKKELAVEELFPYDLEVNTQNLPPLQPFSSQEEFIEKSIACLEKADPLFAECISIMHKIQHLDLDSRKGKAPGGYNMSLPEIGIPFVFMNAAGTQRDVETLMHEAGHAVHSLLMHKLPYNFDKDITSEMAELASMSMELMTYDGLGEFYNDNEKKRAIKTHLEGIITALPWIALIDKFQHWIYTNPKHTSEELENKWIELHQELSSTIINWNNYPDFRKTLWHKQLHLFEIPFYYIEYGIAQLGAIAVWRNYKQNKTQAVTDYKSALKLGYTKTIPEMYKTAGVEFNFSVSYVKELMAFLNKNLK